MVEEALKRSRRIAKKERKLLLLANTNLAERIDEEGMEVAYSSEDDYLRITIGVPKPSIEISWPEDHPYNVVLYDPDTYQINAFEAPFFVEKLGGKEPEHELWRFALKLIQQGRTIVYIPPRAERERAEQAVQDLVPA